MFVAKVPRKRNVIFGAIETNNMFNINQVGINRPVLLYAWNNAVGIPNWHVLTLTGLII